MHILFPMYRCFNLFFYILLLILTSQKRHLSIKKKLEGEVVSVFFLPSFRPHYHSFVASDYQQEVSFGNGTL